MKYIILAAGKGTRLHPFTKCVPKSLLMLDAGRCLLQRTVDCIRKADKDANVIVITGFCSDQIVKQISGCNFIFNPFYDVTNSIASLWFAREHLDGEVVIMNADIVYPQSLFEKLKTVDIDDFVCLDSSIKSNGDYNVEVLADNVVVMSKELKEYFGEYAGFVKLSSMGTKLFKDEICSMITAGSYNEWFENALVQLILNNQMALKYFDICDYDWAEIDTVNDLLSARKIAEQT